jgi:hypothetical protein
VQFNQIRQDFVARVKAILTPEPLAKWQELRGALRAKRHIKGQPKAAGL